MALYYKEWFQYILWGIWNGIANPIKWFLRWCNWMGVVVFGFIWSVVKFTWYGLSVLYDHILGIGALYGGASSAMSGQNTSPFVDVLVAVNTFVPIDLLFAYLSLLLQMWIFWNIYRLVKSWIPTLA